MSIAVAVKKAGRIAIGADTQINFGDIKVPVENYRPTKVRRIGSSYLAVTGWGLYENIFTDYLARAGRPRLGNERDIFRFFVKFWKELREKYPFVNDQAHQDDRTPFADLDAAFLVVNRRGIFHVSGNMTVTVFEQYAAIGSGADYALGALHALYDLDLDAQALVQRACGAALAFNIYCGGQIDVIEV
jgi:ATP-dependent HslUV protease subunit HslV